MKQATTFIIFLLFFNCLHGDTSKIGYNIVPPFVKNTNGSLEGPSVWLWEKIAERHHINYKLVPLSLENTIDGLESGKLDASISPLTITSDRLKRFTFSIPYYIAYSTFLMEEVSSFHKTKELLKSFFSVTFFKALLALAGLIFVFGVLVFLFERKGNANEFGSGIKGLWNGFWWSAVTMTTVGYGDKSPKTVGGRIVALIWMFTAIIVISGFTASIASSLTVNKIGSSSKSLNDFKEMKIGTLANSATENWLKDNFFNNRMSYSNIVELKDAIIRGEINSIAYDRPILQELNNRVSGKQFMLSDINFNPQYYAIGFGKHFPDSLAREISISLSELMEGNDWKVVQSEYGL